MAAPLPFSEMVKLCFFVGLTQEEAARELGVSLSTAERVWGFARAWLLQELRKGKNWRSPICMKRLLDDHDTRVAQGFRGAARRDDLEARRGERGREGHEPLLVGDA